jgi:hypothetical protein
MTQPNAVLLFSSLECPAGAVGRRPLLVFEPYDPSVFSLDQEAPEGPEACLLARGFERLRPDRWSFPYLGGHVLTMIEEFDELALIDEAGELFQYPLSAAPREWFEHISRERNCLIVTGTDLRLGTEGMAGVEAARARGSAFGGSVLAHDGMTDSDR